jgi:predicted nucleic acid-binding protein
MTYLADTSMIISLRRGQALASRWIDARHAGLVGTCPAVEAEELWLSASEPDAAYLRVDEDVERWPRASLVVACA